MPRVSREQTDRNRAAIEDSSVRLFRERGLAGVSVAELMGAAGLTHGGFYGHFASKEALAALACSKGFEQAAEAWAQRMAKADDARGAFRNIVDGYLTPSHRDRPGAGCVASAFVGDVAREEAESPVRDAYVHGIRGMVATLAALGDDPAQAASRDQAMVQLATLIGAMALARATQGDPLSDDILHAARAALTAARPA